MSLLKFLFARRHQKNQSDIALRATAVIDQVIFDVGIETLVNGTFILDKGFRLRFIGAMPPCRNGGVLASVYVGTLAEAKLLRGLGTSVVLDVSTLRQYTSSLVNAVMREFKSQSPALRSLP